MMPSTHARSARVAPAALSEAAPPSRRVTPNSTRQPSTVQDQERVYTHESIQHIPVGPSMSFYREPSPLFSTDDFHPTHHQAPPPAPVHQQLSCGPGEPSLLELLAFGECSVSLGGVGWPDELLAPRPTSSGADSPLALLVPDDFNQYLVEDLFGASQSSSNKSVVLHPQPVLEQQHQHEPRPGPPLIPLASRPRTSTWPSTTSTPLAFPDLNAPNSVQYLPLSFDRVQDRHAAFDAALGSPLLDYDDDGGLSPQYSPDDAYAPSAWDGSPAMTDVDPVWGARDEGEGEGGAAARDEEEARGLRLFGQLSVEPSEMEAMVQADRQQQQATRAAPVAYSPVLAPTQVAHRPVSPCAPLPPRASLPPLPPIAEVKDQAVLAFAPPAPPPPSSSAPPIAAGAEPTARSTRSRRSTSTSTSMSSSAAPTEPAPTFAPAPPAFAPPAPTPVRTRPRRTSRAPAYNAAFVPSASPPRPAAAATTTASTAASPSPTPTEGSSAPAPYDPSAQRVALDAPTRARTYAVESRTSLKAVPVKLLRSRKRARSRSGTADGAGDGGEGEGEAAAGEMQVDDELIDEADRRRRANTLAARVSRQKKKDELDGLRRRVGELEEENAQLKVRNEELQHELDDIKGEGRAKRRKVEEE